MSRCQIELLDNGVFQLSGILSFESVPVLLPEGERLIQGAADINIDLGAVERSDSAGMALLIEWVKIATSEQKKIHFHNMPKQMQAIAAVSGLDKVL